MSALAFYKRLREAGVDEATALLCAQEFDKEVADAVAVALAPTRERNAARQRAWRGRHRDETLDNVTERDERNAPLPETKVSPTPPSKTQPSLDPPKPPLRGSKGSRFCPADWLPSRATADVLEAEGHSAGDLERALTRMRDHEFPRAYSDWDKTFRNWVRRDADRRQKPPLADAKFAAKQANLARAWEGSERAARQQWEP